MPSRPIEQAFASKFGADAARLLRKLYRADCALQEIRKQMPSNQKLRLRKIVDIEVEEIESEKDCLSLGALASAAAERALQRPEIRVALLAENHRLTVDDGGPDAELLSASAILRNLCVQSWPPR